MNNLEKYILENRDELDRMESVPEDAMWQRIKAKSAPPPPPETKGFPWKWLAIIGLVVVVTGWGIWFFGDKPAAVAPPPVPQQQRQAPPNDVPIAKQKKEATPAEQPQVAQQENRIAEQKVKPPVAKKPKRKVATDKPPAPEVSEEERQLQQLVVNKQREIGLDTLDRATYADLLRELDELEISIDEVRKDLSSMPQKERLMETLIRYYELKIRILEQINYEINKQKYHEELEKRI